MIGAYVKPAALTLAELAGLVGQPSKLLAARCRAIPFTGRFDILADIRAWCQDTTVQHGVWLLHAPGGQGKTRLGWHAAEQAQAVGWLVGQARHRDADPGAGRPLEPEQDRPLLLIVDYVDRWPQCDLQLLLYRHALCPGRLRVLLLARSVDCWLAVNAMCDALGITTRAPLPLPPIATTASDRKALFEAACSRFAKIYGRDPGSGFVAPGGLDDPVYGLTLGLHMAALAVVDAGANAQRPPAGAGDLSSYLLDRERLHWTRLHGHDHTSTAARLVFIAALAGAQTPAAAAALLDASGLSEAAGKTAQQLLDLHHRCYPPADPTTMLEPIYPDRLAEDFIALALPGNPTPGHADPWASSLLTTTGPDGATGPGPMFTRDSQHATPGHTGRALMFLAAAAQRHPHTVGPLRALLAADPALPVDAGGAALLAVTPHTSRYLAEAIYDQLPERSVELDPAAAVLAEHLTSLTPTSDPADHARRLTNLGDRLANTGRPQEALTPAEEAATFFRRLAEADPAAYLSDLAMSLHKLGVRRLELGRPEEALASTEEAVTIRRRLVEASPAVYLPDLAKSLNNLSRCRSELERWEQALAPAEEAVTIFRQLAQTNPAANLPDLAKTLNNLGSCLLALGRGEEGLALVEEVVAIYRRLVGARPEVYLPDLAKSLNNLGNCLLELGWWGEALAPAEEAVAIFRRSAEANPGADLSDLAGSLTGFGVALSKQGRWGDALAPAEEAVGIYRRLVEARPEVYLPDLAMSLSNFGAFLMELGRWEEALAPVEEALTIRRRLVEANPTAHLPDLAMSLSNFGALLAALGRREEAPAPAEEAVGIYRRLVEASPEVYLPELARSLSNLGMFSAGLGWREEALAPVEEAVGINRRLVEASPEVYLPELARSLCTFGVHLAELGRGEDALAQAEEAVTIRRQLAEAYPAVYLGDLAGSLVVSVWTCVKAGQGLVPALSTVDEAISIYHDLFAKLPSRYTRPLLQAHSAKAAVLDGLGRSEEANALRGQLTPASGADRTGDPADC